MGVPQTGSIYWAYLALVVLVRLFLSLTKVYYN